jgi:hypothetical protein
MCPREAAKLLQLRPYKARYSHLEGAWFGCMNILGKTQKQHPTRDFNNFRRITPFAAVLSAFGQECNIVSIFCSTGDVLLGFLKVIITMSLLDSFTNY